MQLPVLIEPVAGDRFQAKGGEPFAFTAEGATREEALQNLQRQIEAHLAAGAEIVTLEVPAQDNPWKQMQGIFEDDPWFEEWQQAIAEYRQQVEEDPDIP
jgi:predicted RNase H-like HicB family nuclease